MGEKQNQPFQLSFSASLKLTKADGKAAVSSFGTGNGVDRALSRAPGPSQRKMVPWNPSGGV